MNTVETFGRPTNRLRTPRESFDQRQLGDAPANRLPLLTQYLRIALRWKWLIAGATIAGIVLALVITLLITPQYTAVSTIEISRESDRVLKVEGVEREASSADLEFYQTQYGLLKSRSLAERVARTLKLTDDRQFQTVYGMQPQPTLLGKAPAADADDKRVRLAGEILLAHIGITPVRASRLVQISYTSPDPVLSARISNEWGKSFIGSNLDRKFEASSYARTFLEGRLEQLRQKLAESEGKLVAYAQAQKIINLPGQPSVAGAPATAERSLMADDLTQLNTALATATADRVRAQSRVGASGGASPEALDNNAISALRQKRAEAAAEYAKLMVQFEPGYPAAKALQSQIAQLDASIAREEGRVRSSIQGSYQESLEREHALNERVNGLKSGILDLRRRSIQYNIFQRDVDTNRELYDGLLQRYKEIGVAGGVGTNNVSLVDRADVPEAPSSPRMPLNLMLGLLAGLAIGALAALALEQIDEAITDPTDVEANLQLPLLGVIPHVGDSNVVEALTDRKSPAAEAYISVQTNLEFATAHGVPRSFSVTSTRPSEGKSSTSYALALSLARARRRVIVVDGDMRSPSVHHLHELTNTKGLSNFLSGSDDLGVLLQPTPIENLSVMVAGPQPPNAAELLTGQRLELLIGRLLETHDHVIIDSPPVMGLADAPLIASKVEATIYAVESHGTRARLIRVGINRLIAANANLIGVVLTKFEAKAARYGYGYGYDYGYGYGSEAKRAG